MAVLRARARRKLYDISAGSPIERISSAPREHEIVLKFNEPRTIQDAGNIELSGRMDMEGTPGDLLCLISDGSRWHETSRVVK